MYSCCWECLSLTTHQTLMLWDCMSVRPPSQSVSICRVGKETKNSTIPTNWTFDINFDCHVRTRATWLFESNNLFGAIHLKYNSPKADSHLQPINLTQIAGWLIDGSTGRLTEWQSSSAFALLSPPQFLCPAVSIPLNTPSYRLQIKAALIWISSV